MSDPIETTDADPAVDTDAAPIEVPQTSNPDDVMVPGVHLACGGVNFRRGICRDGYLGRKQCESCAPAVQVDAPASGKPSPSAPKSVWVDFAVGRGADPDEAAAATKAELVARFGG